MVYVDDQWITVGKPTLPWNSSKVEVVLLKAIRTDIDNFVGLFNIWDNYLIIVMFQIAKRKKNCKKIYITFS